MPSNQKRNQIVIHESTSILKRMEEGRRHPVHFPIVERHNTPELILLTVCTFQRKRILNNKEVFELLQEAWTQADRWLVGRFVIMPDHVHLFCRSNSNTPLGQWVRFWKTHASRSWPRRAEQPVWQLDFWDRQLRNGEHYSERWQYVLQNPVRAGLVTDAEQWPWKGEVNCLEW